MRQQSAPATRSLEEVKQQFEHWRASRPKRFPIPNDLWDNAASLSKEHSIWIIAKTLRLDHNALKKRVLAKQPEASTQPGTSFIELEFTSSLPRTEYLLETKDRHGSKLKMQLKGPALPDPLEILSTFWSKGA